MVLASDSKHAAASQRAHLELLQLGGERGYSASCPVAETVVALTSRPSCSGTSRDARGCSYRVRARGGCKRLGGAIRLGQCAAAAAAPAVLARRTARASPRSVKEGKKEPCTRKDGTRHQSAGAWDLPPDSVRGVPDPSCR